MDPRFKSLLEDERLKVLEQALGVEAELHLVGGCLRDALLGKAVNDIDVASPLPPDTIRQKLTAHAVQCIPTGLQHQTVTAVPVAGAPAVEITTFRGAGMRPEGGLVAGTSIEEDLAYRDFTINALAMPITRGELFDPWNGRADLEAGIIRSVGLANERFEEDPLRVLRMIRFACELSFEIAPDTLQAAKHFAQTIPNIAVERIREEFNKMLLSAQPDRALRLLQKLDILPAFAPELSAMYRFEQNRYHKHDLFEHTLAVLLRTEATLSLRLAALLHDIGKVPTMSINPKTGDRNFYRHESVGAEMAKVFLERLRYSKKLTKEVVLLVQTHMRPLQCGRGGLRRLLRDTGDSFENWRALKEADAGAVVPDQQKLAEELAAFDQAIEEVRSEPDVSPLAHLAINGNDLIENGLRPGPLFGEILRALHERVLDDPSLNTKEQLLTMVPKLQDKLADN